MTSRSLCHSTFRSIGLCGDWGCALDALFEGEKATQHRECQHSFGCGLGNDSAAATVRNPSDGSMRRNQKRFIHDTKIAWLMSQFELNGPETPNMNGFVSPHVFALTNFQQARGHRKTWPSALGEDLLCSALVEDSLKIWPSHNLEGISPRKPQDGTARHNRLKSSAIHSHFGFEMQLINQFEMKHCRPRKGLAPMQSANAMNACLWSRSMKEHACV